MSGLGFEIENEGVFLYMQKYCLKVGQLFDYFYSRLRSFYGCAVMHNSKQQKNFLSAVVRPKPIISKSNREFYKGLN